MRRTLAKERLGKQGPPHPSRHPSDDQRESSPSFAFALSTVRCLSRRHLLPMLGLWLALSCSAAKSDNGKCSKNSDCPDDQICFDEGCASATDFAVRITPSGKDIYGIQDFNPVSVAMNHMDLTLNDPTKVEGTMTIMDNNLVSPFNEGFKIQLRGKSSVIRDLPFDQPIIRHVDNGAQYSFPVPMGIWDAVVFPDSPALPPVLGRITVQSKETTQSGLVLTRTPPDSITGHLLAKGAFLPQGSSNHFFAQVIDSDQTTPLSQQASFPGSIDEFSISAIHRDHVVALRIGPDPANSEAFPTKDFLSDDQGNFPAAYSFDLGDYGDLVKVTGTLMQPDGTTPLAKTNLQVSGLVGGGGTYTVYASSDASGHFSIDLFPSQAAGVGKPESSYTLTVRPASDSVCATFTRTFTVKDTPLALSNIACTAKTTIRGEVRDADDNRLADIPVLIEGDPNAADADRGSSVISNLTTDGNGAYSAMVEPGSYRVVAMPMLSRGLPWGSRLVSVGGSPSGSTIDVPSITLSEGHQIQGSLAYLDQEKSMTAVSDAIITVYSFSSPTAKPVKLAEAVTNSLGEFTVILP